MSPRSDIDVSLHEATEEHEIVRVENAVLLRQLGWPVPRLDPPPSRKGCADPMGALPLRLLTHAGDPKRPVSAP